MPARTRPQPAQHFEAAPKPAPQPPQSHAEHLQALVMTVRRDRGNAVTWADEHTRGTDPTHVSGRDFEVGYHTLVEGTPQTPGRVRWRFSTRTFHTRDGETRYDPDVSTITEDTRSDQAPEKILEAVTEESHGALKHYVASSHGATAQRPADGPPPWAQTPGTEVTTGPATAPDPESTG